ncbi:MAG: multicopper oxidase family protein [Gaiellaceae bacterium]
MRRLLVGSAVALVCVATLAALAVIGKAWWDSRLPDAYSVMDYGTVDHGGGAEGGWHAYGAHGGGVSVADLHGPAGVPDARFTLTAREATIRLTSGRSVDALTFDGRSPGPELRVRQGDLVEVTLENEDIEQGVTIHWHGVDVPNAEDGVAGVTQDAVLPGEHHVYRFRAEQVGTFWYHSHQVSSKEVRRGLLGALVIEPKEGSSYAVDQVLVAHTYDGVPTLNGSDQLQQQRIAPGTTVRFRLVNSDSTRHRFVIAGAPVRVEALDGSDLNEPSLLRDPAVEIAGGGRVDVAFAMPAVPVWLTWDETGVGVALNKRGRSAPLVPAPASFDPLTYGRPATTPFGASSHFDRRFDLTLTRKPGFLRGRPGMQWAINGKIFPHMPVFVVDEGDLVEVTITNDTSADHPMHLHGHHVLVLDRDGEAVSGSPWWADTLDVRPGERYRVAFRADNPGVWMDHCHNLPHAADGLTMHVMYAGVTTPFRVGDAAGNEPE